MKHYIYKITNVDCEVEIESTYLTRFDETYSNEDIELFMNAMLLDWYSGGYWLNKEKGQVMYPAGNACYYSEMTKITPEDFKTLNNHHSDMTYKFQDLANSILDKKVLLLEANFKSEDEGIYMLETTVKDVNVLLTDLESLDITEQEVEVDYEDEKNAMVVITIDITLITIEDLNSVLQLL